MEVGCLVKYMIKMKRLPILVGPRDSVDEDLVIKIKFMLDDTWPGNLWFLSSCTCGARHVKNGLSQLGSGSLGS